MDAGDDRTGTGGADDDPEEIQWVDGDYHDISGRSQLQSHIHDIESDGDEPFMSIVDESQPGTENAGHSPENSTKCTTPGILSRLFHPVYEKWRKLSQCSVKSIVCQFVEEYFYTLRNVVELDDISPAIIAVFEATLRKDLKENSFSGDSINSRKLVPRALTLTEGLWMSLYGNHELRKLYSLITTSARLIDLIQSISANLGEVMAFDGLLAKNTPDHQLCCVMYTIMVLLLQRLEVISLILKRIFVRSQINEVVFSSLKVVCSGASSDLSSGLHCDFHHSTMSRVEIVVQIACESLVRMTACICYLKSEDFEITRQCKLTNVISDMTVLVEESYNNLLSYLFEYDRVYENSIQDNPEEKLSESIQFSKEGRVVRQYKTIHALTSEFANLITSNQLLAAKLIEQTEDNDVGIIASITKNQEEAEKLLRSLVTFMDTQSVLLGQLNPVATTKIEPNLSTSMRNRVNPPRCDSSTDADCVSVATHLQTLEFNHEVIEESDDIRVHENLDEIYVGLFNDDHDSSETIHHGGGMDLEEKVVSKLYSGVVHQLRTALIPVKTNMKRREREAKKKVYGDVAVSSDEDSESYSESVPKLYSNNVETSNRSKPFVSTSLLHRKKRSEDDDGDSDETEQSSAISFPSPFMMELKSKLNAGLALPGMSAVEISSNGPDAESDTSETDVL